MLFHGSSARAVTRAGVGTLLVLVLLATAAPTVRATADASTADDVSAACTEVYPLAMNADLVTGTAPGTVLPDAFAGGTPGNRGWLTWSGVVPEQRWLDSLLPPGNSAEYVNPRDPSDTALSVGDWVRGRPGIVRTRAGRQAIEALYGRTIVIPLWDETEGSATTAVYRIAGFAKVQIASYQIARLSPDDDDPDRRRELTEWLAIRYLGPDACGAPPEEATPVVVQVEAEATRGGPAVTIPLTGQDADPNSTLTFETTAATHGEVGEPTAPTCDAPSYGGTRCDATVTYTPPDDFVGTDTFTYTVDDGGRTSDPATVTITVGEPDPDNRPPTAQPVTESTAEDIPVGITLTGSDPDGDPLTYQITSDPAHGQLTGTGPDRTYTPDPDYFGPDTFTYTANDGQDTSNTATVTITITPVNDPPVANDDTASTAQNTPITVAVLDNDRPGPANEGPQTLTVQPVNPGSETHGTVTTDGATVTYTPDTGYRGAATFEYEACDNGTTNASPAPLCDPATVTVQVGFSRDNLPPTAADDAYTTGRNKTLLVPAPGMLGNDHDPDPGDVLKVQLVRSVSSGALSLGPNGAFTYSPAVNMTGVVTFRYRAVDSGSLRSGPVTVTITVGDSTPNGAPNRAMGMNGSQSTPPGSPAAERFWEGVSRR